MVHMHVEFAAVMARNGHGGGGLVRSVVRNGEHLVAKRHDIGAIDNSVGVLRLAGRAEGDSRGATVIDAEFALQAIFRRALSRQLQNKSMYPQIDTLDIIGPQAVLFPQSNTTIDAGMNDNAAGKGFERIERNFETFAELVGYFVPIEFGRNNRSKEH